MEQDDLDERLRVLVAEHLGLELDSVRLDMLIEEVANSLELSTLVMAAEREFEVQLSDSSLGRVRILADVATIVREARDARQA